MILSGVDNHPPMLDKDLYDSCKSRMEFYMQNREQEKMILESFEHDQLIWPYIEENRVTRTKKYPEVSATKKIQADCDMKATNIILSDLHTTNFDQLHAYLEQNELLANEACLMRERNQDPLALVANHQMTPPHFNTYQSSYNNPQLQQQGNNASRQEKVVKCYICQGEGHMARQCTHPKQPRNAVWYKDKSMLAEAGQILDEEQLVFLTDLGVPDGQAIQSIIPNNAAFQTEDLDTYDSDCDDILNAKAVLMANISNYGSDFISEAQHDSMILSVIEQMSKQMINHVNNLENANKEQNNESITAELERYKERVKNFGQRLNIDLRSHEK
nr:hypothetical protein [Tanacetum cinerariifolium]